MHETTSERGPRALAAALLTAALAWGCGGDGASEDGGPSGSSAGSTPGSGSASAAAATDAAPPPRVDPEARYDGRTLDEYAVGLDDLSPAVRLESLGNVLHFGANAFPLRDRMRRMAVEDPEDELRAGAMVALVRMEDPGAEDFLVERLRDPEAMQTERGWKTLLQVVVEDVETQRLVREARALVGGNVAHGETLLDAAGSGVPRAGALRTALAEELVRADHADATVPTLLAMLHGLELTPAERLEYVRANHARLPSPDAALSALRTLGGADAFALTLEVLEQRGAPLDRRLHEIRTFPAQGVPAAARLDAAAAFLPAPGERELQQVFAAMQAVVSGAPEEPEVAARFQAILTELAPADGGQDPGTRALALLYLCDGAAAGTMGAEALDPVFAALRDDPEEIVLGTALQELQKLAPRAPADVLGALPAHLVDTMYARPPSDPWAHAVAQGALDVLRAGLGKVDADASLTALVEAFEAHTDHPVNAVLIRWLVPQAAGLERAGWDMPTLASLVGRLQLDGGLSPAEHEWLYNSNLTQFNNVTSADIETIVAYYEPAMFAESLPAHRFLQGMRDNGASVLHHVWGKPEGETYRAFLERVGAEGPPEGRVAALWGLDFYGYRAHDASARRGAAHFEHELAGRPARVCPVVLGSPRRRMLLQPAAFLSGEPDQVFLATRRPEDDPPALGGLHGLETPLAVAFLDAHGSVLAVGRTDDPALQAGRNRTLALTHPTAAHALLHQDGAFDLSPGDSTGLDPEFLAALWTP